MSDMSGLRSPLEHLRDPRTQAALVIQNTLVAAARDFLSRLGVVEVRLPLIGPVTDPGARGAKQVDLDYYGQPYRLMTSAILYKQVALTAFDAVFAVAPNVRLEPLETASTSRHLTEFHQIDVEVAHATRAQAMRLAEDLLRHMVGTSLAECEAQLTVLGSRPERLARVQEAFDVMTHTGAVDRLAALGTAQNPHSEISWESEETLSGAASRPFFVTDYPKGSRGFYDRESRSRPGTLVNFDLLAPEGFGELASGGEREVDYPCVVTRIRETGENPAKYGWYLDALRDGIPPSAGFGLGLERVTRFVTGTASVWEGVAFPKPPGVFAP